jgi:pyruvate,water dikinase
MGFILKIENVESEEEFSLKVGGKAYNLGLLKKAGYDIPRCLVLTTDAYDEFLRFNGLEDKIRRILEGTDFENLNFKSLLLKREIMAGELPVRVKEEIEENIKHLVSPFYAVRSSAVGEDSLGVSFAGVHDSFLGVSKEEIFEAIKKCWASLYNPSAIFLRLERDLPLEGAMSVIVKEMVRSEVSGVCLSYPEECIIEAIWGLGSLLVSGEVEPDIYVVDKNSWEIREKRIGNKNLKAKLTSRGVVLASVHIKRYCLSDETAVAIARLSSSIEKFFGLPQDIEWALERDKIFILQSRPINVGEIKPLFLDSPLSYVSTPLIRGRAFIEREVEEDGILVIRRAEPGFVLFLKNAKAVICEEGGVLNHFAILCRELGIPYFLMRNATKLIRDSEFIEIRVRDKEYVEVKGFERVKWMKIMSFIPSPPPPPVRDFLKESAENLPRFINKEYKIETKIRKGGIYLSNDSLKGFLRDLETNLSILYENLKGLEGMSKEERNSLPILAALIVEHLFEKLCLLTGSRNIALNLIKGTEPLYLMLDRKELERYLLRFGVRVRIPGELKKRAREERGREEVSKFLKFIPDAGEAEKLAFIIKTLIQSYEAKDLED